MKYLGTVSDSADLTNKKYVDDKVSGVSTSLTNHTNDTDNPHSVTKSQLGLGNVENKSSATIRGELTKDNVTTALGYTPPTTNTTYTIGTTTYSGTTKLYTSTGTNTDGAMTQKAITDAIPSLSGYATQSWVEGKGYLTSAPVTSVNSKTGAVTLTYSDVGALPSTTTIPSKTSQLTNDSGYITSSDIPDLSTVIYGDDVTTVETTTPLNADTLEGHSASYFAAASSLATVATSGSYNDLSNTPSSNQLRAIYVGTADPSSSLGSNGDIYIKYSS